ncbi:hypothetical protein SUGI_1142810 [Cryptomeria japonica]|uniref:BTB/POZ domain-containing protein At5g48800 n=1 Tax=Cryptomeria japonica TaxID=3369 RepID=UPI002414950D|nr:BTB/POZ domain-containing protein At5g48800 [Cryptomeria japonica]GLJ53570.1 hypothetical protein SUGI_1142810 [Cryptomeria japonica]
MAIGNGGLNRIGVVDTIYEDEEEEEEMERAQEFSVGKENVLRNSGRLDDYMQTDSSWIVFENGEYSSSVAPATYPDESSLESIVSSWSEATGFSTNIAVHIMGSSYHLHKLPLVSMSGYFNRKLKEANEIHLNCCPGGAETFELIVAHCYGCMISMEPSTIAAIRCASDFFEMTEDYSRGNLCKRSHRYFKDTILKNWDHAIEALRCCEELHPIAQYRGIVSTCIEAISQLTCTAIEKRAPVLFPLAPMELTFGGGHMENLINDLITLPLDYFRQIIESIRRKCINEKFICRSLFLYTDRSIFDRVDFQGLNVMKDKSCEMKVEVECVVKLLPMDKDIVPVTFLFGLLRCSLAWNADKGCSFKLENRISSQLDQATAADFLLPLKNYNDEIDDLGILEIESMQHIVSLFMSQQTDVGEESDYTLFSEGNASSHSSTSSNPFVCNVAKVWDEYLTEIATYSNVSPAIFLDLVETVPSSSRPVHDQLYKAIDLYLKMHSQISETDRTNICKMLNCQRLSEEVCFHAVRNEFMPLRMIVQAICVHQLQTNCNPKQPLRSRSLRYSYLNSKSIMNNSNGNNDMGNYENKDLSLGSILRRDGIFRQAAHLKSDLEETSSRLRSLEEEIKYMKEKLNHSFRKGSSIPTSDPTIAMPAPEEFSKKLKNMSDPKKSYWANKGCGGGGLTQRVIKSLQKLRLRGIRKSKPKHTAQEVTSEKSRSGGDQEEQSNSDLEINADEGLAMDDDEMRYPIQRSLRQSAPISLSCRDIKFSVNESKHCTSIERSNSMS